MNLLTIIVLVFLVLRVVQGYRNGLIKSFSHFFTLILSIMIVSIVSPYVTEFLETKTPVYTIVKEKCGEVFEVEKKEKEYTGKKDVTGQEKQTEIIDQLPLPKILKNSLIRNNNEGAYHALDVESFAEYVSAFAANRILNMISLLASWLTAYILVRVICMILESFAELPVIHSVNKILGSGLSLAQGILIIWLGFILLMVFENTQPGRALLDMVSESVILKQLYESNLIWKLVQSLINKF